MGTFLLSCLHVIRPKQWSKNFLLLVAPFAAGELNQQLFYAALALIAFCLASSIGYIYNDINDVLIDRLHPAKKSRPFASGDLSTRAGVFISLILILSLIPILFFLPFKFHLVLVIYLAMTFTYTRFFKFLPVVEMFFVASGFVLRLIAGGVALELTISKWFLIVGGFGALFIVASKRIAEKRNANSLQVRKVVSLYNNEFLLSCITLSAAVSVIGYCLWAFSHLDNSFWFQLSVVPLVMGIYRYIWIGQGSIVESPEDAILDDRSLLFFGASMILLLSVAIYL